jgi:WD40-like Beta Propeller Repeat
MRRATLLVTVVAFLGACTFQPGSLLGGEDSDAAPGPGPDAPPPDGRTNSRPDAAAAVPPDATAIDAAGPPVLCDFASLVESQPLTPALVANVNTAQTDRDPFVTADGKTLFLMSSRPGGQDEDIWTAKRADRDADFSAPGNAGALNSSAPDTRVSMTADELVVVLSSARGGSSFDVYVSERQSVSEQFPAPALLAGVNTGNDEFDPVISLDGLRLYLAPSGTGGDQDILMGERGARDGVFSTPQPLPVVNTPASEADPAFTADERLIVFARGNDIFYATRATRDQDFSAPRPLTAINTAGTEADPFVTADGCELFFASERAGGVGNLDIYRVRLGP